MKKSTATTATTRRDIAQEVTNRVIKALESNTLRWRKTWSIDNAMTQHEAPKNYATNKEYKGINYMLLNWFAEYETPYFLTFAQALELGGNVKKGSKAEQVIYYNRQYKAGNKTISPQEYQERKNNHDKDISTFSFLKYYNVFNISDVEGIKFDIPKPKPQPPQKEKNQICENIILKMPTPPRMVSENQNRCFYSLIGDVVNMPKIEYFESSDAYYHTFFHELAHSTGHPKRLNREGLGKKYGSKDYAFEELIAELSAAYLAEHAGILKVAEFENTASYLKSWLKGLKDDKTFIFRAAAEAQKCYNYITGSSQEEETTDTEE